MRMQTSFVLNEVTILLEEVNNFMSKLMKIYNLIEEVSFHKFRNILNSNNFLTYSTLKNYDQEIIKKYGLYSPIPLTEETLDAYLSEAVLLGLKGNTVRLILPYVEADTYDIWKFHPFPIKIGNSSVRSVMNIIEPYAIVSTDRQLVLTFDDEAFKYCSKPRDKYFACFPVIMLKPNNQSKCATSILRRESVARCSLSPFSSDEPLMHWVEDERYLSLSKPQKVVMICEDHEPQEKWLSEVTKIATPCEVKNHNLDIPSLRVLHKFSTYKFPVINVSAPTFEITPIEENFEPRRWIDPKWLNITSPRFKITPKETYNHVTLAVVWTTLICVVAYLIRKRWRRFRSKNETNPTMSTTENIHLDVLPLSTQRNSQPQEPYYSIVRTPPQRTRRTQLVRYEVQGEHGPEIITVGEGADENE